MEIKNYLPEVKLVSFTSASDILNEEIDKSDLSLGDLIVYCARVSNPDNQHHSETAPKLLKYLMANKHWSPFEMVDICMEIKTTRDISRQMLRHRSFVFQEFSQRYARASEYCFKECRLQDFENRQNSIAIHSHEDYEELQKYWHEAQELIIMKAHAYYLKLLDNGVAKEQARCILPEGNTYTRLYMKGSVRSWIHYIELRSHKSTQKEHRMIANLASVHLHNLLPELFDDNRD